MAKRPALPREPLTTVKHPLIKYESCIATLLFHNGTIFMMEIGCELIFWNRNMEEGENPLTSFNQKHTETSALERPVLREQGVPPCIRMNVRPVPVFVIVYSLKCTASTRARFTVPTPPSTCTRSPVPTLPSKHRASAAQRCASRRSNL